MNVTTKGLIDILPFDDEFRTQLKGKWDTLSQDQKIEIGQLMWNTYADIYQARFETNVDVALLEVANGQDNALPLDKNFGKKVRERTNKEIEEQANTKISESTLTQTREALQRVLTDSSN